MSNASPDSPELGPTIIEDDDALWALLDLVIIKLPGYVTLRRKIVRRQERLRALASDDAWDAYLRVEALTNERNQEVITALVRWAFGQGRRSGDRRR